jgi:hypothetical protein
VAGVESRLQPGLATRRKRAIPPAKPRNGHAARFSVPKTRFQGKRQAPSNRGFAWNASEASGGGTGAWLLASL